MDEPDYVDVVPVPETAIVQAASGTALREATAAPIRTTDEEFELEIARLIPQAGTVVLTDAQKAILYAPVPEDIVEIRPDGLIYLPWMEYVDRLTKTFGMSWSIVPKGGPKMNPPKTGIMWGFYLIIEGKLAGYAIGEQAYYENNPSMTWGDAAEGAKSNALMRLCKGIGVGIELWRPSFVRKWKEKYAEEYFDQKKNKKLWRKRGGDAVDVDDVTAPPPPATPPPTKQPPVTVTIKLANGQTVTEPLTAVYHRLEALKKHLGENAYRAILGECGYTKKNEIPISDIPKVYASLILIAAGPIPMKEKK